MVRLLVVWSCVNFCSLFTIDQYKDFGKRIIPSIRVQLTEEAIMVSIPKVVGLMSCGFLLCLGLSTAAQVDEMKGGQDSKKGEQAGRKGEQDKLKKDDMKAGQSTRKGGQAGVKGEEDKSKGAAVNAGESTDKRNEKGDEVGDPTKGGY